VRIVVGDCGVHHELAEIGRAGSLERDDDPFLITLLRPEQTAEWSADSYDMYEFEFNNNASEKNKRTDKIGDGRKVEAVLRCLHSDPPRTLQKEMGTFRG
jgi:hypothetical protein